VPARRFFEVANAALLAMAGAAAGAAGVLLALCALIDTVLAGVLPREVLPEVFLALLAVHRARRGRVLAGTARRAALRAFSTLELPRRATGANASTGQTAAGVELTSNTGIVARLAACFAQFVLIFAWSAFGTRASARARLVLAAGADVAGLLRHLVLVGATGAVRAFRLAMQVLVLANVALGTALCIAHVGLELARRARPTDAVCGCGRR
jgi:hypothetical protein